MRQVLKLHPDSRSATVTGVAVDVARPGPGLLSLRYVLSGATGRVKLPPPAESARVDGLWRHSCFEAFVRAPSGEAYYEFNLAPSTQWAAYRFDGYRRGMRPAEVRSAPKLEVGSTGEAFELRALLDLAGAPDLGDEGAWRLGLAAVVEEADGGLSYWGLAHPPGKPDFHHADCFAVELPATGRR
ncbi:MAG TPA: DOMON-like domain-containing protein [Caulobacteraceae bacterium]|jgi:hypothetical protein|nr:DOMON-like domain-containing protein [Caulobacteraceae bacterium]